MVHRDIHPLADIEIVAWDSSLTLFISKDDILVHKFRIFFPFAEDLSAQNTQNNSEISHIQELLKKELVSRNIDINERTINLKYPIWRKLYLYRTLQVRVSDIYNALGILCYSQTVITNVFCVFKVL